MVPYTSLILPAFEVHLKSLSNAVDEEPSALWIPLITTLTKSLSNDDGSVSALPSPCYPMLNASFQGFGEMINSGKSPFHLSNRFLYAQLSRRNLTLDLPSEFALRLLLKMFRMTSSLKTSILGCFCIHDPRMRRSACLLLFVRNLFGVHMVVNSLVRLCSSSKLYGAYALPFQVLCQKHQLS